MIDHATVQRIKDTANIVEVVGDYVHLTRRGANYMGLCPFHNERTPSFSVNPRGNFCYCFSCHKGGSPVNFIMEKEGVSYHEALLQLAKKYGIRVEERELSDEERQRMTEREGLMIAAERAMQIMEQDLTQSEEGHDVGLSYFRSRGITDEAIRKFHLGYAINNGQYLTQKMQREGFDIETLYTLGLSGKGSQSGRYYDKYRGRVIFPIMNASGKVVGFGGRDLQGSSPAKYINSPESVLYKKSNELYGIAQAKNEIRRQDRCYLVEGYMDVISMWQSGMQNVVASSGTALTDGQIAQIHRFTSNITLIYDGDNAGIHAALRGIDMLLSHKMQVKVLLLPDGHDPDSFAKAHTAEEFREYVEKNSTDIIRFKMQALMANMGDSAQDRARVINEVAQSLAFIPDDVERAVYISECSRELRIDEATVARAVETARHEIIRRNQEERRRREFLESPENQQAPESTQQPQAEPTQTPEPAGEKAPAADKESVSRIEQRITSSLQRKQYPLLPVEKSLISQLVRYGYMNIKLDNISPLGEETEEDMEVLYTLTDFVQDELEANSLSFTLPAYEKIFHLLLNHLDDYVALLDEKKQRIYDELKSEYEAKFRDIPSRVSTPAEIEREEKKIAQEMEREFEARVNEFSRYYPGNFLASHEDDEVRSVATELMNDRHVLSTLYTRNSTENPEDRLSQNVARAIREWKSELLNLHLNELLAELEASDGEDPDHIRQLQLQIAALMQTRSQMAKQCGERIICAR